MPTPADLAGGVTSLSTLAAGDLRRLWRSVTTPDQAREALQDILPALVRVYGAASATLAADWYDDTRAEAAVRGRFRAAPATLGRQGAGELARWAVGPLFSADPDWERARTMVEGGLQRRIANASRDTVAESSVRDPRAQGWQRVGGGACAFCALLIGRGVVYSESSVSFAAHDHCRCQAVPAFDGQARPVEPSRPSEERATDADRSRVSSYLDDNDVG